MRDFFFQDDGILGPGTDLTISLVAVLAVLVAATMAIYQDKERKFNELVDLDRVKKENEFLIQVKKNQLAIIESVADEYSTDYYTIDSVNFSVPIFSSAEAIRDTIRFTNNINIQKITFGEKLLFKSAEFDLQPTGERVIKRTLNSISDKLRYVKEIQIQGHTDNRGDEILNLQLGANRAIEVYNLIVKNGISPLDIIISANSYGYYKPFSRTSSKLEFSQDDLDGSNDTEQKKSLNRRIEIVFIYGSKDIEN